VQGLAMQFFGRFQGSHVRWFLPEIVIWADRQLLTFEPGGLVREQCPLVSTSRLFVLVGEGSAAEEMLEIT
jgi:hypothetical protein